MGNNQIKITRRRLIELAGLLLLVPLLAFGQAPAAALTFEVATIKPVEPITPAAIAAGKLHVGMNVVGDRVDIGYMSLAELIPIAFKVKPYQVSGPDWMRSQRFDILAKLPAGATKEQVPELLQALLQERFQLKAHRENRENNVYALVVGKGGPNLKESPPDSNAPAEPAPGALTFGAGDNQFSVNPSRGGATVVSAQGGTTKITPGPDGTLRMEMSKVTMPAFVEMLTPLVDRPVVDMTELKGNYQVAMDISMETIFNVARSSGVNLGALGARGAVPGQPAAATDPSGSSIFTSIQQLGLRLESRKMPAEFIVVDHVEKMPSEN